MSFGSQETYAAFGELSFIGHRCQKEYLRFQSFYGLTQDLETLFEQNCYFAGGCVASLICKEEPQDWDIFIRNNAARAAVVEHFTENPAYVLAHTENAITLRGGYQIIIKVVGAPYAVTHEVFDFKHTWGFFEFLSANLVIPDSTALACAHRRLLLNDSITPEQYRLDKFLNRGWVLDHGELEVLQSLANTDLGFNDDTQEKKEWSG